MKERFLGKWFAWIKGELVGGNSVIISRNAVTAGIECLIRMAVGFVLAGAGVFGGYAPFGLGFIAASGATLEGFFSLLGAGIGYLVFWGFGGGLKYVAIGLLIFSSSFVFRDSQMSLRSWFMPLVAAVMTAVVGFVFLLDARYTSSQLVFYCTEIILVAGTSYFYGVALGTYEVEKSEPGVKKTVGYLTLAMGILICLARVELVAEISLGRLAATLAVIIVAYKGGFSMGAVMGITAGLAMDIALGKTPFYSMAYGFSGLLAGVFFREKKIAVAITYVLANAIAVLWTWNTVMVRSILYETFAASVIFMVLPTKWMPDLSIFQPAGTTEVPAVLDPAQQGKRHLEMAAKVFREIYESLAGAIRGADTNDNDIASVFTRTADRVCRQCVLSGYCWQRNYESTKTALNDATKKMVERGYAEPSDFPSYFSEQCKKLDVFISRLNEELTALMYRRQSKNRVRESRRIAWSQYRDLSDILSAAASEMSTELTVDQDKRKSILKYMQSMDIDGNAAVYTDQLGRLRADIQAADLTTLLENENLTSRISALLGVKFSQPDHVQEGNVQSIRFTEQEPYTAAIGICAKRKRGEEVSGDSGTYFKGDNGILYVILSDGMGTGPGAAKESTAAVRLLERFLRAGVEPKTALNALNSAFILRADEYSGFATVDLLCINLFSGNAEIYKWGAAPSYLKRGAQVVRLGDTTTPPGIGFGEGAKADLTKLSLNEGDFIIIASDGIADRADDEWLKKAASSYSGDSPKELSACILEEAEKLKGCEDDMTVLIFRLQKN